MDKIELAKWLHNNYEEVVLFWCDCGDAIHWKDRPIVKI